MKAPTLQTPRLILNAFQPGDAEAMFAYASDPDRVRYMSFPRHRNLEDSRVVLALFEEKLRTGTELPLAIRRKEDGLLLGGTGLGRLDEPWTEIGWILSAGAEGQGLAYEALSALLEWSRRSLPGSARLRAHIHPDNLRSIKLARRLGFEQAGTGDPLPQEGPKGRPQLRFTLEPRACRP